MKNIFLSVVMGTLLPLYSFSSQAAAPGKLCVQDLEYLPQFLLDNDTGARDHLALKGQRHFDRALDRAIKDAAEIKDINGCNKIINTYLKSWRHGHLSAMPTKKLLASTKNSSKNDTPTQKKPTSKTDRQPKFEALSQDTLVLSLPSFAPKYRLPLVELLKVNRQTLTSTPNWIIDVRKNNGGSDTSYEPLLPWIMETEYLSVGAEWLVTPSNIEAQKAVCSRYDPDNKTCFDWMKQVVTKMEKGAKGQFVQNAEIINYHNQEKLEARRPEKVAVLIDRKCGSSCEEFLLTVRQSFNVKLLGRRTYGSLDYSNLRPQLLPSGNFELYYATSRSLRLPNMPVDIAGVIPDIYLPKNRGDDAERQEVLRVKNWLEGGSLAL